MAYGPERSRRNRPNMSREHPSHSEHKIEPNLLAAVIKANFFSGVGFRKMLTTIVKVVGANHRLVTIGSISAPAIIDARF